MTAIAQLVTIHDHREVVPGLVMTILLASRARLVAYNQSTPPYRLASRRCLRSFFACLSALPMPRSERLGLVRTIFSNEACIKLSLRCIGLSSLIVTWNTRDCLVYSCRLAIWNM